MTGKIVRRQIPVAGTDLVAGPNVTDKASTHGDGLTAFTA
jgi:hypothetical protein